MVLVKQSGRHWQRSRENLDEIEDLAGHQSGVYVPYHSASDEERCARGRAVMQKDGSKKNNSGSGSHGL